MNGNTLFGLVFEFCKIARVMQNDYVESWLKGERTDFDMDMVLLDEKMARQLTYKKIANEIQSLEKEK